MKHKSVTMVIRGPEATSSLRIGDGVMLGIDSRIRNNTAFSVLTYSNFSISYSTIVNPL